LRTREEIEKQRNALAVVAADNSPVPDIVRQMAREVVHSLTWVLGHDCTEPYYILAGCCCLREKSFVQSLAEGELSEGNLELGCALGPNFCLCPGLDKRSVPDVDGWLFSGPRP
jgi:hypothetical protein